MAAERNVSGSRADRWLDAALWLVAIACALATLWFSFGASLLGPDTFRGADKVGHALAYFATTLSFLFAAVWRPGRGDGRLPNAGYWFPVVAVLAGIAIEILQSLTPTRSAQAGDVVAEVVGAGLALGIHALVRRYSSSRQSDPAPDPSP